MLQSIFYKTSCTLRRTRNAMYRPTYRALQFMLKAASYEGLVEGLSVFFV